MINAQLKTLNNSDCRKKINFPFGHIYLGNAQWKSSSFCSVIYTWEDLYMRSHLAGTGLLNRITLLWSFL